MRRALLPTLVAVIWMAVLLVAIVLLLPPFQQPMGHERPINCLTADPCTPYPANGH